LRSSGSDTIKKKTVFFGKFQQLKDMLFAKRSKTIFVLRKNQLSSFYFLCGIAYLNVARKMVLGRFENNPHNIDLKINLVGIIDFL
jgi:hypothetical protein